MATEAPGGAFPGGQAGPCQVELAAASSCLYLTVPNGCRPCYETTTFEQDFPTILTSEYLSVLEHVDNPASATFGCNEAAQDVCLYLEEQADCCCHTEQEQFAYCYIDQVLGHAPQCPTIAGPCSTPQKTNSGISPGRIVGIVIICMLAIVLIAQCYWGYRRRRKQRQQQHEGANDDNDGDKSDNISYSNRTSRRKSSKTGRDQSDEEEGQGSSSNSESDDSSSISIESGSLNDTTNGAPSTRAGMSRSRSSSKDKHSKRSEQSQDIKVLSLQNGDADSRSSMGDSSSSGSSTTTVSSLSDVRVSKRKERTATRPKRGSQSASNYKRKTYSVPSADLDSGNSSISIQESFSSFSSTSLSASLPKASKGASKSNHDKSFGGDLIFRLSKQANQSQQSGKDPDGCGGEDETSDHENLRQKKEAAKKKKEIKRGRNHEQHQNHFRSQRSGSTTANHLWESEMKFLLERRTQVSFHLEKYGQTITEEEKEKWENEKSKVTRRIAELQVKELGSTRTNKAKALSSLSGPKMREHVYGGPGKSNSSSSFHSAEKHEEPTAIHPFDQSTITHAPTKVEDIYPDSMDGKMMRKIRKQQRRQQEQLYQGYYN